MNLLLFQICIESDTKGIFVHLIGCCNFDGIRLAKQFLSRAANPLCFYADFFRNKPFLYKRFVGGCFLIHLYDGEVNVQAG